MANGKLKKIIRLVAIVIVVLLALASLKNQYTGESAQTDTSQQTEQSTVTTEETRPETDLVHFYVDRVVDGDTIWVYNDEYPDGIKVRYIGINTPESVHADESKNTAEGKESSNRNSEIIEEAGYEVYLEYGEEAEDQYGRTLAYVFYYDGQDYVMIQDVLLSEGLCNIMPREPNTKYADHFREIRDEARANDEGFWGTGFYS